MENKSVQWQTPYICRCCLSSGCYKDISTEYFWLGKREVYSEMLLEVFNITLTDLFDHNQGTLICEVCISRLRDATTFKNQVLESERRFLDHIYSLQSPNPLTDVKIEYVKDEVADELKENNDDFSSMDDETLASIKVEPLKIEKQTSKRSARAKKLKQQKKMILEEEPSSSTKKESKDFEMKFKLEVEQDNEEETSGSEPKIKLNSFKLIKNSNMTLFRWCRNKYRCFCCKETFLDPKLLRVHSKSHNLTEIGYIIDKHMKIFYHKVDISDLKCNLCLLPIGDIELLMEHLKSHNVELDEQHLFIPFKLESDILQCQVCFEVYKSYVQLDKHMNNHYKNHICETCGKGFKNHEGLRDHTKRHKKKEHVCKKCDIVFTNYYRKRQHDIGNHNLKVGHVCPHCPEKFNSYHNRLWHLVKFHNYEKPEFKCVTCEKVFYNNSLLRSHIRKYHLQERNVQCGICDTRFFRKCDLTEHMKNHTKERKFVCTFCGKSFIWKKNLNIHLAIHNNVRRHVCNVCGKSFVQGTSLKYHLSRHHAKGQTENIG